MNTLYSTISMPVVIHFNLPDPMTLGFQSQGIPALMISLIVFIYNIRGSKLESESYILPNNRNASSLVPVSWTEMCSWENKDDTFVYVNCYVYSGKSLNFLHFRLFTSKLNATLNFSVEIKCQEGGAVTLPYPGRARLLFSLNVTNCTIDGYFSERKDRSIDLIPDSMKYLVLKDCRVRKTKEETLQFFRKERDSQAFTCGPLGAVEIVESNLKIFYVDFFSFNLSARNFTENLKRDEKGHAIDVVTCEYPYLRLLDKSKWHGLSRQQLNRLFQNRDYPVLEVLNLSSCEIRAIPRKLYDWGLYMRNLRVLDLSNNDISSDLSYFTCHDQRPDSDGVIDLRHNNITFLKRKVVNYFFGYLCSNLTVYVQNNPFHCDCYTKDLIEFLHKTGNFTGRHQYQYMYDLKCQSPPNLHGKLISGLTLEDVGCETILSSFYKAPIIGMSIAMFFVILFLGLAIRYRKEIVILAYTRLNIRIPYRQSPGV